MIEAQGSRLEGRDSRGVLAFVPPLSKTESPRGGEKQKRLSLRALALILASACVSSGTEEPLGTTRRREKERAAPLEQVRAVERANADRQGSAVNGSLCSVRVPLRLVRRRNKRNGIAAMHGFSGAGGNGFSVTWNFRT